MPRDRREHPAEQVIWISPGRPRPRNASSAAVAHELAGDAVITQLGLTVWDIDPGEPYGLTTEVDAVNAVAKPEACRGITCSVFPLARPSR